MRVSARGYRSHLHGTTARQAVCRALGALGSFGILAASLTLDGDIHGAFAQEAPRQQASASEIEEVVVTGSRIERSGFEAPTPTTMLGPQQIETAAPANLADFVNQLPQLGGPGQSPQTTGNGV